jgi:hypothetical protein
MLYYKINKKDLTDYYFWIKFVHSLQSSLSQEESFENKILVVKLQDVNNDNNTMIPKLEHKKN